MTGLPVTAAISPATTVWDAHYASQNGRRWWPCEELVRFLSRHFPFRPDVPYDLAVDVGCGNGSNLELLYLSPFRDVVGVEPCARARALAANRYNEHPRLRLVDGEARALPVQDATADLVVDCMTSQHLLWADHAAAYAQYSRVLRPGGWLFLYHLTNRTTGGTVDPRHWDVPSLALFPDAGPTCLPTRPALVAAVEAAGFRAADVRGLAREYPDGSWASYAVIGGQKL